MAESYDGGITMGALPKQKAVLFHLPQKVKMASWHDDWRGRLVLATLNTGIGIAALATVGIVIYAFKLHIFHL